MDLITIDDFKKIDLRVATIKTAERVEGSDKLIKLSIDLGEEARQLVAGIGRQYEPEMLIEKQIIVIANLQPRMLMGLESRGMLLAAHGENGEAILLTPDKLAFNGSSIS
ncbi:MAG TPA: methionine--tRNA ligase subunit beta [Candidatus Paceibacterota bacterium]|nr:methionine--tRNA ligase subunit beta [Candidatus Paceibacterota bacterium]